MVCSISLFGSLGNVSHDNLRRVWPDRRDPEALAYRLVERGIACAFPLAARAGVQVLQRGGVYGAVLAVVK